MEEKINIVKILADKPKGTKLYSSACGKCKLEEVDDKSFKISFYNSKFGFMNGGEGYLDKNGKLYDDGECIIFPSKEMRDWSKFAWKKGDVLINSCGFQCIFKEWASDDYTKFNGCYSNSRDGYEDVSNAETAKFVKLDNILNPETLEIEKAQPKVELKSLDMVLVRDYKDSEWYFDTFESMVPNCIYPYKCMMNLWKYCIPYKGNEDLLGTTKDVEG